MIKVVLLGAGNVAIHLAAAFQKAEGVRVVQRYNRSKHNYSAFDQSIPFTNKLNHLAKADIYIIAISDDAISGFSANLNFTNGIVVHTSGSVTLNTLKCKANKGVFYPLQTFSKSKEISFNDIPICIEAESKIDLNLLNDLAHKISSKVYQVNSAQREKLHIAAVFANNFSNHMFKIAHDICESHNMSFDILKPLILETAQKIQTVSPEKAQTGPAKRNDEQTIQKHLSQLEGIQKEIYNLVTQSIKEDYSHGKEL